jgi:putative transcriptional regulator
MKTKKIEKKATESDVKIDFSIFDHAEKYRVEFHDIDRRIDGQFVKNIREKLNTSQSFFAHVLGVSKKTIEKWEQGKNPIKGTASRLLYSISLDQNIINNYYCETISKEHNINKIVNSYEQDLVTSKWSLQQKTKIDFNPYFLCNKDNQKCEFIA